MLFEINYIGCTFHLRSGHYAYNYVFKCVCVSVFHICHHKTYEREAQYSNKGMNIDCLILFLVLPMMIATMTTTTTYFFHTLHAISYLISKQPAK